MIKNKKKFTQKFRFANLAKLALFPRGKDKAVCQVNNIIFSKLASISSLLSYILIPAVVYCKNEVAVITLNISKLGNDPPNPYILLN